MGSDYFLARISDQLYIANLIAYSDMLFRRGIYTTGGVGERVDEEIMKRLFTVREKSDD